MQEHPKRTNTVTRSAKNCRDCRSTRRNISPLLQATASLICPLISAVLLSHEAIYWIQMCCVVSMHVVPTLFQISAFLPVPVQCEIPNLGSRESFCLGHEGNSQKLALQGPGVQIQKSNTTGSLMWIITLTCYTAAYWPQHLCCCSAFPELLSWMTACTPPPRMLFLVLRH